MRFWDVDHRQQVDAGQQAAKLRLVCGRRKGLELSALLLDRLHRHGRTRTRVSEPAGARRSAATCCAKSTTQSFERTPKRLAAPPMLQDHSPASRQASTLSAAARRESLPQCRAPGRRRTSPNSWMVARRAASHREFPPPPWTLTDARPAIGFSQPLPKPRTVPKHSPLSTTQHPLPHRPSRQPALARPDPGLTRQSPSSRQKKRPLRHALARPDRHGWSDAPIPHPPAIQGEQPSPPQL